MLINKCDDERDGYHELICLRYRPRWSQAQKDHYEHAYGVIRIRNELFEGVPA